MPTDTPYEQAVKGYQLSESALRIRALELALDACKEQGETDGQTVIRRAVGFYEFLSGNINKKKVNDGLTGP